MTSYICGIFFGIMACGVCWGADGANLYPFKDHPKLSWVEFEREFRARHSDLEIPPIVCDKSIDSCYLRKRDNVTDSKDDDLDKINKKRAIPYERPVIVINTEHSTPYAVSHVLLHEIGHHNYDLNKREKNYDLSGQGAENLINGYFATLTSINVGCSLYNAYKAFAHNVFYKKVLIAQLLVVTIPYLQSAEVVGGVCSNLSCAYFAKRPEEYAADDFANQHATLEELRAGKYCYSKQGSREYLCDLWLAYLEQHRKDFVSVLEQKKVDEILETIKKIKKGNDELTLAQKFYMEALYYVYIPLCDIMHPSPRIRYNKICETLKNRFGVDEK